MEPAAASTSLQGELKNWIQILRRGDNLTCFGKSRKGERCHNKLGEDTRLRLTQLFEESVALLESSNDDLEKMLEEASSLVMCVRYHHNQSPSKLKEWLGGISGTVYEHGDNLSLNPTSEMSTVLIQNTFSSKEKHTRQINTVDTSDINEVSKSHPQKSSLKPDLDDSGLESGDDEDMFITQSAASKITKTVPQTPQKSIQPTSTDSAISMSYDTSAEPHMRATEYKDIPESPLTGKFSKAKQGTTKNWLSRPAATPIQPMPLSIRPKRDFDFAPFQNPFTKMQKYISKPLGSGEHDLKGGYIYGFQLDGCAYTKIGKSAIRKEKSPEASLVARMKEHENACWPDLKIVLRIPVPFVGRMENLIKFHLEPGRMKEKCSCKGSRVQTLAHGNHTEWFNNSLDEIWTVVIAWQHWILSMPYVRLDNGLHQLSPEWKGHLEKIGGFQTERDIWLDWLCQHVPDLRRVLIKDSLESNEWIENQSTVEGHGSFVRSSAAGFKSEIKRTRTTFL